LIFAICRAIPVPGKSGSTGLKLGLRPSSNRQLGRRCHRIFARSAPLLNLAGDLSQDARFLGWQILSECRAVRNWTRNVRTPDVLSFVASSEAHSSNSLSQPNRLSSQEKLILLTSRIRAHVGPLDVGPVVKPKIAGLSKAEDVHFCPPAAWQLCITFRGPRVSAIRAYP
jgi:hypothetical protein